jgi:hypothetical protein
VNRGGGEESHGFGAIRTFGASSLSAWASARAFSAGQPAGTSSHRGRPLSLTTPNEEPQPAATEPPREGPAIPDFEKDAATLSTYREAKQRFERRESQDAESKVRIQFAKRREAIRAEIAVAGSLLEQRIEKAHQALTVYARRYPKNMDRVKALKPSFWESLFSMGAAGRMYRAVQRSNAEAMEAQTLRRRKENDEEELEKQLKRALYLQEDALKRRLGTPEMTDQFHRRPGVSELWEKVQEIQKERATYVSRLALGEVSPVEQRDRDFAERKISDLEVPFSGMLIVQIASYGDLHFFILRSVEKQLFALPYDPRLEPLLDQVFDFYRIADSHEAKLHRAPDNRPFTALDHYFANFKDEEVARHEYRKARTLLRAPRELPAATIQDPAEQTIVETLANFARTLGPPAQAGFIPPQAS